ncbi:CsxC family protein [Clostridium sp. MT-14]|uniref:DUF7852 domain-containing protein n=1 Tax=Clostridium aromativorans TaxID=2836848 RepID=A0ABS8N7U4_9CLOT|nr:MULTISPECIES: hypothetical protein [Clostridium]MCC9295881.1 hypothetical protein [Clostridium aromativorans]CAB1244914.1 conserved hypothetical protein [Clostridiaceae bacterium BL-3]
MSDVYESGQKNEVYTDNTSNNLAYNQNNDKSCAIVTAKTEGMCDQIRVKPDVIPYGDTFVKIPVILAETNITIPVEATITLDKEAIEIKRIKKNVYLTQCRLIPFSQDKKSDTGILYISGFVRKNIEYATEKCISSDKKNICGDIRHCTVKVPFNCTTRVKFIRKPFFRSNPNSQELQYFTDSLKSCDVCADPIIGRNPCDQNFTTTEIFNEKPFCELVKSCITEVDIHKCPVPVNGKLYGSPMEQEFRTFTEKIVIDLTLKVLQKQQVRIDSLGEPKKTFENSSQKYDTSVSECTPCDPVDPHDPWPKEKDC